MPISDSLPKALQRKVLYSKWFKIWTLIATLILVIFLLTFDFTGFINGWRLFANNEQISGVVTGDEDTNVSINDYPVVKYYYTFAGPEIGEWHGYSFGTDYKNMGDTVNILYKADNPGISKIEGMNASQSGLFSVIAVLFFVVPFLLVARYVYRKNKFKLKVLNNGKLTGAKLIDQTKTGMEINNNPVYALKFEYSVGETTHNFTTKTHLVENFIDDPTEPIIYLDEFPDKALIVDSLPAAVSEHLRKRWKKL